MICSPLLQRAICKTWYMMQCDTKEKIHKPQLNPNVQSFRPKRAAAADARAKISAITEHEMEEI